MRLPEGTSSVVAAWTAHLEALGAQDTYEGLLALQLAACMDEPEQSAASVVAASAALRGLAEVIGRDDDDPIDELRMRREWKGRPW